jgi:ribosomal protein L33
VLCSGLYVSSRWRPYPLSGYKLLHDLKLVLFLGYYVDVGNVTEIILLPSSGSTQEYEGKTRNMQNRLMLSKFQPNVNSQEL